MSKNNKTSPEMKMIEDLKTLLVGNLRRQSFTVLSLASELGVSDRQLNRNVKKVTGLTIGTFIREVKLNEAKKLLEQGSCKTISEVSSAVGFKKQGYFSKIYEARFSKRPAEYFNRNKS